MWGDVDLNQSVGDMELSFYGQDSNPLVKGVSKFQYLGRTINHTGNDWTEVHHNIGKALAVYFQLRKLL